LATGPKARRRPAGRPCPFFKNSFSNIFLNNLKAFSRVAPKIKVAANKILYNFALKCNLKIQIDFEL
jgi:hypothetical protein